MFDQRFGLRAGEEAENCGAALAVTDGSETSRQARQRGVRTQIGEKSF